MQFVTASDTAHFISASSGAAGSSCAVKAATVARASPSLTDSDGSVKALNAKGELDPSCTEVIDKTLKQFTISRDTDANDGQLAPSGFTPIVRNISQR